MFHRYFFTFTWSINEVCVYFYSSNEPQYFEQVGLYGFACRHRRCRCRTVNMLHGKLMGLRQSFASLNVPRRTATCWNQSPALSTASSRNQRRSWIWKIQLQIMTNYNAVCHSTSSKTITVNLNCYSLLVVQAKWNISGHIHMLTDVLVSNSHICRTLDLCMVFVAWTTSYNFSVFVY